MPGHFTRIMHAAAGLLAAAIITAFMLSTLLAEAFGDWAQVAQVKIAIAWGLILLIPALAGAGASGFAISGSRRGPLVVSKLRRMRGIALNGALVLAPSALFLAWKAQAAQFDQAFAAVQAVELVAGCVNLVLIGLNIRDGLRMTRRFGRPGAAYT